MTVIKYTKAVKHFVKKRLEKREKIPDSGIASDCQLYMH